MCLLIVLLAFVLLCHQKTVFAQSGLQFELPGWPPIADNRTVVKMAYMMALYRPSTYYSGIELITMATQDFQVSNYFDNITIW